jgi:hypothetical protein
MLGVEHSFLPKYTSLSSILPEGSSREDGGRQRGEKIHPDSSHQRTTFFLSLSVFFTGLKVPSQWL